MDYLGSEYAEEKGYSLYSTNSNKTHVTYINYDTGISVDFFKKSDDRIYAKFSFIYRMLSLTSGDISYPGNIDLFEKMMLQAVYKLS